MKIVMKMYVENRSIFLGEESHAENNQTKENRTDKKDLPTYLTPEEKAQGKWKGLSENTEQ